MIKKKKKRPTSIPQSCELGEGNSVPVRIERSSFERVKFTLVEELTKSEGIEPKVGVETFKTYLLDDYPKPYGATNSVTFICQHVRHVTS